MIYCNFSLTGAENLGMLTNPSLVISRRIQRRKKMKRLMFTLLCSVALTANAYGQALGSLIIDTLVGSGLRGDGGPATSAQLDSPHISQVFGPDDVTDPRLHAALTLMFDGCLRQCVASAKERRDE
jgi:hypothetical protein